MGSTQVSQVVFLRKHLILFSQIPLPEHYAPLIRQILWYQKKISIDIFSFSGGAITRHSPLVQNSSWSMEFQENLNKFKAVETLTYTSFIKTEKIG